eukprot:SAG11_NODE_11007_length_790_cov_0.625181_2_plen_129_part_01
MANLQSGRAVAVQKTAEGYGNFGAQASEDGSKWDLRSLKLFLASRHGMSAANQCFKNIEAVVVRTLRSVERVIINDKHCFELYGYDVLIDADLKPWLIEVNSSPALTASSRARLRRPRLRRPPPPPPPP